MTTLWRIRSGWTSGRNGGKNESVREMRKKRTVSEAVQTESGFHQAHEETEPADQARVINLTI